VALLHGLTARTDTNSRPTIQKSCGVAATAANAGSVTTPGTKRGSLPHPQMGASHERSRMQLRRAGFPHRHPHRELRE
jgi:hypothetical protein